MGCGAHGHSWGVTPNQSRPGQETVATVTFSISAGYGLTSDPLQRPLTQRLNPDKRPTPLLNTKTRCRSEPAPLKQSPGVPTASPPMGSV